MSQWPAPEVGQTHRVNLDEIQGFIGIVQGLHGYHDIVLRFDTTNKECLNAGDVDITILSLGEKVKAIMTDEELEQLPVDEEERAA